MKISKVGIILVAILFVGVSILLYPSFSQFWNSKTQTRAIENYQEVLKNLDEDQYKALFEEADAYNASLAELSAPLLNYNSIGGYDSILNVSGTGIIGYITIDKINVELPIYHGTSEAVLDVAVGHLEGSSFPVGGPGTHCALSAHRGLSSARLFTDLDKMEVGDTFVITVLDRTITYQVDQIKTVLPTQTDDLIIVDGEDYCTLTTCTPYGINSHRLLVRGTRIENAKPIVYVTSDAFQIDSLVAAPVVAAPMLLILLIYLLVHYRKPAPKPSKLMEAARNEMRAQQEEAAARTQETDAQVTDAPEIDAQVTDVPVSDVPASDAVAAEPTDTPDPVMQEKASSSDASDET